MTSPKKIKSGTSPLSNLARKKLQVLWNRFRKREEFLNSIPDQNPVLKPSVRPKGYSGVYYHRLSRLNYEKFPEKFFKDRNRLFKKNFVGYILQVFSTLIESEILPDGTLTKEPRGCELRSKYLKKISRNYSLFNKTLNKGQFLDQLSRYKVGKSFITYGIPRKILKKGYERVFLSEEEKQTLIDSIGLNSNPDTTSPTLNTLLSYYSTLLKRTTIDSKDLGELEIEVGRFRRLYPGVIRHQQGKLDLSLCLKTGRLLSVYLNSPKEFRGLLKLDGKHRLVEGDVGGSHFHFLLEKMTDLKEREEMKRDLLSTDPYLSMCGNPKGVSRKELKDSSHIFKYGNRITKYYPMSDTDWLKLVPYKEGLFFQHLSKKYPVFTTTMSNMEISHKKHRSQFSCEIMMRESKVMVQMVGQKCMKEKLVYLPVHDGFMTLPTQYDRVSEIVKECFKMKTGSVPLIRQK